MIFTFYFGDIYYMLLCFPMVLQFFMFFHINQQHMPRFRRSAVNLIVELIAI